MRLARSCWSVGMGVIAVLALLQGAEAVPGQMGYQGRLTDSSGAPVADGTVTMRFALYGSPSGVDVLWEETQPVAVAGGIYSVQLGAENPLASTHLASDAIWLEVTVNGEVLDPRQRLTSVPFALQADLAHMLDGRHAAELDQSAHVADTANPHGVSAAQTGAATPSEVTTAVGAHAGQASAHHAKTTTFTELTGQIADAQIPSGVARDSELLWSRLGGIPAGFADGVDHTGLTVESDPKVGANTPNYLSKWNGSALVASSVYDNDGAVGIGVSNPATRLQVDDKVRAGSASHWAQMGLDDEDGSYGLRIYRFWPGILGKTVPTWGHGDLRHDGSALRLLAGDGILRPAADHGISVANSGNVGVGVPAPEARLHVAGQQWNLTDTEGDLKVGNGTYRLKVGVAVGGGGAGDVRVRAHGGTNRLILGSGIEDVLTIQDGKVGVGTVAPSTALHVVGAENDGTTAALRITAGAQSLLLDGNEIDALTSDNALYLNHNTSGNVHVASGGGRLITPVLQITGGADLSEEFRVRSPSRDHTPSPGMVVSIDPDEPGHLVVSSAAYDRRVAGILSGAGGVRPGMLLGQRGSELEGSTPVALSGRVYCYADASPGAIAPGDLLTTSDTPGHAMRVADHGRAQGAILGKAMSRLDDGRGLVLVLVSLQ